MNYFLCKEKLPWLIIKHEERQRYFNALEEAQVSNNIVPFMNYIQSILDRDAVVVASSYTYKYKMFEFINSCLGCTND